MKSFSIMRLDWLLRRKERLECAIDAIDIKVILLKRKLGIPARFPENPRELELLPDEDDWDAQATESLR